MTHIPNAVSPTAVGQAAVPINPEKNYLETPQTTKVLYCDVVFGSPSMNCNGTGICRINISNFIHAQVEKKQCQLTSGLMAAGPGGKVSLFFFRERLCIRQYRKHFRKGVFEMTEACPIPASISKELHTRAKKLLPGSYTVWEGDGYFRLDIDAA